MDEVNILREMGANMTTRVTNIKDNEPEENMSTRLTQTQTSMTSLTTFVSNIRNEYNYDLLNIGIR